MSLHSIEEFYRKILDNIPADIVALDQSHKYLFINKTAVNDETRRAWLIGKDDFQYFKENGGDIEKANTRREFFNNTIASQKQVSFQEDFLLKSGEVKNQLRVFNPVFSEGKLDFVVGYGIEVTNIKKIEERDKTLFAAIEAAKDGIAILDANGNYTYMNEAHSTLFGTNDKQYFIGKSWKEIYQASEVLRIEREIFPELMQNGTWTGMTQGITLSGAPIKQQITLTSIPNNGLICITRDLTEVVKIKDDLQKLALVASKTNSMVIITNATGEIDWVNEAFTKITGYVLGDVAGRKPDFLHGPETSAATVELIWKAIKRKRTFTGEIQSYTKEGKKIYLYINLTPVFDEDGNLTGYISVENDISELKIAEEKKQKAEAKQRELSNLKADFVSMVSHEFRTPISIIQSSTDILQSVVSDSNELPQNFVIKKHLSRIDKELQRMTDLMNRVLVVGKMNVGKVPFHPVRTDIRAMLNDIREIYVDADSGEYLIDIDYLGIPFNIKIDPKLMEQVLRNLISNAVKFSHNKEKKPIVTVIFKKPTLSIVIEDFGIGVPEEAKEKLFDVFYRAENAKHITGTGLGMAVVKNFLDMHNAKYTFSSELGVGFKFIIKIGQ